MKKRFLVLTLLASTLTVGTGSFFISRAIYKRAYEKEKAELNQKVFEIYYYGRINLFKEENKNISNIDVSFVGDSLTDGYDVKSFYPDYNVINRGINGDNTFGVEKRLDCSVYDVHPKVVNLLIGANNFDTMLDNYETIVTKIKTNVPDTKIILCSLTSMTGNWAKNNEKARKNNIKIQEIAERNGCYYADLYNALLDSNTNELKSEYSLDGGHLTNAGYQVVTSVITPILKSVL